MEQTVQGGSGSPNRIYIYCVAAVFAVIVLAVIFYYVWQTRYYISTDDAYVAGSIHAIASKIPGTAKEVLVRDNQPVKKGDLLVEIDSTDFDVRVLDAKAAVEAEESKLRESSMRIEVARKQLDEIMTKIGSAKANLVLQDANLRQSRQDLDRSRRLYESGALAEERLEKAQTGFEIAQAQLTYAGEQVKQAQAALETQNLLVLQAETAYQSQSHVVEQKRQVLGAATLTRSYAKISAPSDGYVTRKSVEPGNQVQAGQPLMAIVPLDDGWVLANYKETQLARVQPGQQVEIKVDTYDGKTFKGKVDSIMAGTGSVFSLFPPENATGNYVKVVQRIPVKIVLDQGADPDHVLRIGMSVQPTIAVR